MKNTISAGAEILDRKSEIILNEDYCIIGKVLSVSSGVVAFSKVWDESVSKKIFYGVVLYDGLTTKKPPDTDIEIGSYMPFYRVGEFNSPGKNDPELRSESAYGYSWIGFIEEISTTPEPIKNNRYLLRPAQILNTGYQVSRVFDGLIGGITPIHYRKARPYRNSDFDEPYYVMHSRVGYATWTCNFYQGYSTITEEYSTLVHSVSGVYDSTLHNDVAIPCVGSGVTDKKSLVPTGYHPFDTYSGNLYQWLELVEVPNKAYTGTVTQASSSYLYHNAIDMTTLIDIDDEVTIATVPPISRKVKVVKPAYLEFTESIGQILAVGVGFTVTFKPRKTIIYNNDTRPMQLLTPVQLNYAFWPLTLSVLTEDANYKYFSAQAGYVGVCEESDEMICVMPAVNGTKGGHIPNSQYNFTSGLAYAYTKSASYNYAVNPLYKGGCIQVPKDKNLWYYWDEGTSSFRTPVAGETAYFNVFEYWDSKQRRYYSANTRIDFT